MEPEYSFFDAPEKKENSVWLNFLLLGFSYGPMAYSLARRLFVYNLSEVTDEDINDGIAVGQVMPGAVLANFAAYLGYLVDKIRGAFAGMLIFIFPSFVLMVVLSFLYGKYGQVPLVQVILRGMSSVMIALLFKVVLDIFSTGVEEPGYLLISLASFLLLLGNVNIAVILVGSVAASLLHGVHSKKLVWEKGHGKIPDSDQVRDYLATHSWFLWMILGLLGTNSIIYLINPEIAAMNTVLFKIGLFTFGNGYTMLPFIYKEVVQSFHWLTPKEFSDGIVLGQITPGPVIITATFVGYKVAGVIGAIFATISIFLPSTMLVALASETFVKYKDNLWMKISMKGILSSFIGLLTLVIIQLGRVSVVNFKMSLFTAVAIVLFVYTKINPMILLLVGLAASILFLR